MRFSTEDEKQLAALRDTTRTQVAGLIELAADAYGRRLPQPTIRFDLRGQSAGQVRIDAHGNGAIRFNPWLLLRYQKDFVAQTVPHETAHWVVFCLHGRRPRPHGPEWARLMRLFGAEPKRCHEYALDQVPQRHLTRHSYHCGCREHQLSAIRHNRARKGQVYRCRQCGGALRPGRSPNDEPQKQHYPKPD